MSNMARRTTNQTEVDNMKKLLALMLAAALALSLAACGGGKDRNTDFTGELGVISFDMTIEDIFLLEYVNLSNEVYGTQDTFSDAKEQMASEGEELPLPVLQLLIKTYGGASEIEDDGDKTYIEFWNGHIYRISNEDGKLDFVKWMQPGSQVGVVLSDWEALVEGVMDAWTESYGKPEENKNFYTWYGNVNGENASLSIQKGNGKTTASMIELDRVG